MNGQWSWAKESFFGRCPTQYRFWPKSPPPRAHFYNPVLLTSTYSCVEGRGVWIHIDSSHRLQEASKNTLRLEPLRAGNDSKLRQGSLHTVSTVKQVQGAGCKIAILTHVACMDCLSFHEPLPGTTNVVPSTAWEQPLPKLQFHHGTQSSRMLFWLRIPGYLKNDVDILDGRLLAIACSVSSTVFIHFLPTIPCLSKLIRYMILPSQVSVLKWITFTFDITKHCPRETLAVRLVLTLPILFHTGMLRALIVVSQMESLFALHSVIYP